MKNQTIAILGLLVAVVCTYYTYQQFKISDRQSKAIPTSQSNPKSVVIVDTVKTPVSPTHAQVDNSVTVNGTNGNGNTIIGGSNNTVTK